MQRETFTKEDESLIKQYMRDNNSSNPFVRLNQLMNVRFTSKLIMHRWANILNSNLSKTDLSYEEEYVRRWIEDNEKKEFSQINMNSKLMNEQYTSKQIRKCWPDSLDPSLNHDKKYIKEFINERVYFVRDLDEIKKFSQIKNEREFSTNLISLNPNLSKRDLSDEIGQINNEREFSFIRNVEVEKVERTPKRTRALLDENKVLILRPNEKFLTWEIPSAKNLDQQQRNLNAFQLFRLHYFKTLFNNSKHHSIKASKLSKINDEVNEAWNDSEIIRENYQLLRQNVNDSFVNQLFNGSNF
ncbi:hypothetical protein RhiirA1_448716 [Rhizophagus irregularis]|uniref:Uncharacterized protein n=1 Tax=Rhizophagus irregularis TaxID=588596 RepID=A0A2N0SJ07_9GLOM|nr:hypothetical protein RhiirA1_448716 [Rhizophagus irregularis]